MLEYHRSQDIKQRGWEPKVRSPDGDTEEQVDVPQALEYYEVHNNGRRGFNRWSTEINMR
ncbi:uncharacterized protein ACLA_091530 [Aspergillus clavatus NRRL 1]|uniref:Uncharacterized protein n=1 Tax=Aspergillus clavatus (strain ATCC 1007 / CBS 513.65 / DSM 816 / NCTC 3887 / NRRL 1 / QM 1276 / 107) TaxID=344612 RepID=A1CF06_ASPCL|nr:uncharacterized protein ACLA_091530 [Aspergillus clavatus NRRL 1]EAW11455.1 hypothetical protein ACLA_091530 [Aspergillus clavatus NRRL 1]